MNWWEYPPSCLRIYSVFVAIGSSRLFRLHIHRVFASIPSSYLSYLRSYCVAFESIAPWWFRVFAWAPVFVFIPFRAKPHLTRSRQGREANNRRWCIM